MSLLLFRLLETSMEALRLFLFTVRLQPMLPDETPDLRMEIAQACVDATPDRTERFICAKIPRFEAQYRSDVADCRKKGAAGEVTAWQILPYSKDERARLCISVHEDAVVAIERIRESRRACRHLPPAEQLALYTRGNCGSEVGRKLSRIRWPYERETTF